jgi:hypothetical protein
MTKQRRREIEREKKKKKRKKERKREERSITFKKPNATNSQNLLKIGYQPTQIDKKTPRNCMPTIGNLSHTQQKSLANETEQKFTNFFIQKIYLPAITKTEISIEKKNAQQPFHPFHNRNPQKE